MAPIRRPLAQRFWQYVDVGEINECWEWKTQPTRRYPSISDENNKSINVHCVAYILQYGPIPKGLYVLHDCDNSRCCNYHHLHLGTPADNMREKRERNRTPRRANGSGATLTEQDFIEIHRLFSTNRYTFTEIGNMFNVHRTTIQRLINGTTWK